MWKRAVLSDVRVVVQKKRHSLLPAPLMPARCPECVYHRSSISMNTEARVRKRIPKSCKRCHRRKQRCVGYPTCAGCESAQQPCLRSETAPSWHHAMSKGALVHRIEMLESQLAAAVQRALPGSEEDQDTPSSPENLDRAAVVSLLSLGRDHNEEPAYLGPSSGRTVAENLGRIVHDTVWTESLPINAGFQQSEPLPSSPSFVTGEVSAPGQVVGARLVEAYFRDMHTRLPFLDRSEIHHLHERLHQKTECEVNGFGRFKIFMVYALGASILQMTDAYDSTPPRDFWAAAINSQTALKSPSTYARIEAIMLLVLYDLRSSSHSSVWYTIGLGMRICVDLGLHREGQYRSMRQHEAQLRRRLFWSVYLVERYVSWSLGRPFSIAEKDIDVDVPADMNDTINDDRQVNEILRTPSDPIEPAPGSNIRRFISTIRLQRIMSQMHSQIYRVDRDVSALIDEVPPLMTSLEDFEQTQPVMDLEDSTFVRMHWHNCVRMLLQRFLSVVPSENSLIRKCLYASGQMCQCFKTLRQRASSGYSFLLVNSLFMAGLTMWYVSLTQVIGMADITSLCLFRAPQLWSIAVSDDLRACSLSMFMMAERNTTLRKYRDGLETMMTRAIDFVNSSSNSLTSNAGDTRAQEPTGLWSHTNAIPFSTYTNGQHGSTDWSDLPTPPPAPDSLRSDGLGLQCHGLQEMLDNLQSFGDLLSDDFWADIPWASMAE
ncbi:uncharacterized protein BO97DRAFT_414005 [Aspergillus homomorphus CBS 101889]|uniref:Zn(2)-C6 fungal-type domain-containing protein n=1 Tax=Aspergillus homomorphus (strain CBS 101889) TaxID=1450537 RepID=A0A395HYQ0_ASPHC|nr:hypothetical protein BO97DRAFT_414005 [Aspergillus homomorphus CBS 101889]RAL12639.1 hypothetical protein BO97DRAFT_414005 [Aspergillus homomorphus CBS 101889]